MLKDYIEKKKFALSKVREVDPYCADCADIFEKNGLIYAQIRNDYESMNLSYGTPYFIIFNQEGKVLYSPTKTDENGYVPYYNRPFNGRKRDPFIDDNNMFILEKNGNGQAVKHLIVTPDGLQEISLFSADDDIYIDRSKYFNDSIYIFMGISGEKRKFYNYKTQMFSPDFDDILIKDYGRIAEFLEDNVIGDWLSDYIYKNDIALGVTQIDISNQDDEDEHRSLTTFVKIDKDGNISDQIFWIVGSTLKTMSLEDLTYEEALIKVKEKYEMSQVNLKRKVKRLLKDK